MSDPPKSKPLVVLVDDDPAMLETLEGLLKSDWSVRPFTSGAAALAALESLAPDVIVSDIVMPEMGGFELRRAYAKRFGARATPFFFLSSIGDAETMVAGLEAGADDFIVKPVVPDVLRARLRVALRRRSTPQPSSFRGDFADVPFTTVLHFCESKRFTGELVVAAEGFDVALPIAGGELDQEVAAPWIDRLWDLANGTFVLRAAAIDFAGLPGAGDEARPPLEGRLSSVVVRGRRLQIQTELVGGDAPAVVTLILAGGEPVSKLRQRVPADADEECLREMIASQHEEAEASTRDRVSAIRHRMRSQPSSNDGPPSSLAAPASVAAPASHDGRDLFDEGFEHSRRGDWSAALACWERALAADPESRTLAVNIAVAKKKLATRDAHPA